MHLRGHIFGGDVAVMAWKSVSLQAERANPDLRSDVDIAEWVEHSFARRSAYNRVVLKQLTAQGFERR